MHRLDEASAGAAFWRWAAGEWSGFDAIDHELYPAAFRRWRGAWSPDCMAPEARAAFDALSPHSIRAFRGQDAIGALGLSWTLNRTVAQQFAHGHRGLLNRTPLVLERVLEKNAIAFAVADRDDAEIVLFAAPIVP